MPPPSYKPLPHPPKDNTILLILPPHRELSQDSAKDIKRTFRAAECIVSSVICHVKGLNYGPSRTAKVTFASAKEAEKAFAIAEGLHFPFGSRCRPLPYPGYIAKHETMATPRILKSQNNDYLPLSDIPPAGRLWEALRPWGPIQNLEIEVVGQPRESDADDPTLRGRSPPMVSWSIRIKFYYEQDARNLEQELPMAGYEFTVRPIRIARSPTSLPVTPHDTSPNTAHSATSESLAPNLGPYDKLYDWATGTTWVRGSDAAREGADQVPGHTTGVGIHYPVVPDHQKDRRRRHGLKKKLSGLFRCCVLSIA